MGRVHMPPSRLPLRAHFDLERETSGYEAGRVTYGAGPLSTTEASLCRCNFSWDTQREPLRRREEPNPES